jgi:murein tripeptide amidase MpaA
LSKFAPAAHITDYTSTDPCQLTYQGPHAFSEPETQNVKWLLDTNPRTRWFVDVHSYAQDILYSWGDDQDQSTTAAMNFANPAFDGLRGVDGDAAYKEYIPGDDWPSSRRSPRSSPPGCKRCAASTTP